MQIVMVNFLIMFDVVFVFFLFLIAVTCIMNYMPGRKRQEVTQEDVDSDVIPPPPLFAGDEACQRERDTYVVISPPIDTDRNKDGCPIHVV
ncbi:unnamed protein product [Leptosia nina]|uniref:Uncharacterized protein n=1 Tax=Leptosia nina TaxID=320188 RepID=A0AAV1IWA7_9NEOP